MLILDYILRDIFYFNSYVWNFAPAFSFFKSDCMYFVCFIFGPSIFIQ